LTGTRKRVKLIAKEGFLRILEESHSLTGRGIFHLLCVCDDDVEEDTGREEIREEGREVCKAVCLSIRRGFSSLLSQAGEGEEEIE
jgi:hypothetical protein